MSKRRAMVILVTVSTGRSEMERNISGPERIVLPTPDQLHKLSSAAIFAADRANKLKHLDQKMEPTYGWIIHDTNEASYYQKFSGRLAKRVATTIDIETQLESKAFNKRHWSLRYIEMRQQHVMNDFWLSELKRYAFEWNHREAIVSRCETKTIPSMEQTEIDRILALDLDSEDLEALSLQPTDYSLEIVDNDHVMALTNAIYERQTPGGPQRAA